jgi:hypothetical protein
VWKGAERRDVKKDVILGVRHQVLAPGYFQNYMLASVVDLR